MTGQQHASSSPHTPLRRPPQPAAHLPPDPYPRTPLAHRVQEELKQERSRVSRLQSEKQALEM